VAWEEVLEAVAPKGKGAGGLEARAVDWGERAEEGWEAAAAVVVAVGWDWVDLEEEGKAAAAGWG